MADRSYQPEEEATAPEELAFGRSFRPEDDPAVPEELPVDVAYGPAEDLVVPEELPVDVSFGPVEDPVVPEELPVDVSFGPVEDLVVPEEPPVGRSFRPGEDPAVPEELPVDVSYGPVDEPAVPGELPGSGSFRPGEDPAVPEELPVSLVRPLPPESGRSIPAAGPADPFGPSTGALRAGEPRELIPLPPAPPPNRRAAWIGGAVIGVVVVAALAGVIWFRNLIGDPLGSARSIPAQAQMVITLDGLQLVQFDEVQSLIDAFADPAGEPGAAGQVDILDALDEAFDDAMGVDFRNGVLPWVGRTASFAMWDVASTDMTAGAVPELMFAVEVRDAGKAESFLARAMDLAAAEAGTRVDQTTIGGVAVLVVAPGGSDAGAALYGGVAGDVMILTASDSAFRDALAAREGSSIVDSIRYTDALSRLPVDRLMTAYLDGAVFDDFTTIYRDLAASFGQPSPEIADPGLASMAGSFTLVEAGLQFDAVTVYRNAADVAQVDVAEPDIVSRLPAETLAYLAFPIDGAAVDEAMATLEASAGAEFEQMAAQLEAETGIDVFGELLPAFDGGAVLAGYATREGMLGRQLGGFGLLGAIGVSDRQAVADALAQLDDLIQSELGADPSVVFERVGDLRVAGDGIDPIVTWSLGEDTLAVGSSITEVEAITSGTDGGIYGAALYQELDAALPGDGLLFYLDMAGMLDLVQPPPEIGRTLAPLRGMGASADINGSVVTGRLVIAIDY